MMKKILVHITMAMVLLTVLIIPGLTLPAPALAITDTIYDTTSDGEISSENNTYVNARNATTGLVDDSSTQIRVGQRYVNGAFGIYSIFRGYLYFDTSSIPDDAVISAASLCLYGASDNSVADFSLNIGGDRPLPAAYPHDPLAAGDFDITHYDVTGGVLNTSGWNTADYNIITLNSMGYEFINKTGSTRLVLLSSGDILESPPFGDEFISFYSAEYAGTDHDPYLTVTYNTPPTAGNLDVTTFINTPVMFPLNGGDTETCDLGYHIESGPTHGGLGIVENACSGSGPYTDTLTVTYYPPVDFVGTASFTYTFNDGELDSNIATVNITVCCIPGLETEITSPSNGATFTEGDCFAFDSIIRHTLPSDCPVADYHVYYPSQTITIDGPARFQVDEEEGELSADGKELYVEMGFDWEPGEEHGGPSDPHPLTICCTGEGDVTISVALGGYYLPCDSLCAIAVFVDDASDDDFTDIAPSDDDISLCFEEIPEAYLKGDSVTIKQVAAPEEVIYKPRPKPFEDSSSSWSMPPNYAWPKPADTSVLTAYVQPDQVTAGQPVTIMANVKNSGELPGSYTAELLVNGEKVSSQIVSVPANASEPVEFTLVRDKPGVYTVDIGGQVAYFTVVGGASKGLSSTNTIVYTILGVLALVAVALGIFFVKRSRLSK